MARSGSDPFVEKVREATDIVEIVGAQVELKKAGSRLQGLCPFHSERTPSFYVNPTHQAYHCFGCGAGGDVFSFVMQHEKMSFPEALHHLAERAGIPIPTRRGPATDQLERIREALRVARACYQEMLRSPAGAAGRSYLDRREITEEWREAYGLGLSVDAWDGLLRHARSLVSERTLVEAGLVVEGEQGRTYDRFRNRLMIPLDTAGGAPVGFGARALGDAEPKYLNSPETAVYRKGSILFGIGPARDGIRTEGRVVVVEGYFDVIAMRQGGIPGVVGTCGTALTPEQGTLLKRLSERVILLFDGDSAGLKAALRALPVLVGEVGDLRIAFPPAGKDPDLWVRQNGATEVRQALENARSPLALLESMVSADKMSPSDGVGRASELITRIRDPLVRDLWIQEASSRFGIRTEAFYQKLREPGERGRRGPQGPKRSAPAPAPWSPLEKGSLLAGLNAPRRAGELADALEEEAVLENAASPERVAGQGTSGTTDASGRSRKTAAIELLRWLARVASEFGEEVPTPAALLSWAAREVPDATDLTALVLGDGSETHPVEAILTELRRRGLKLRAEAVTRAVRRAQENGNQDELLQCLAEKQEVAAALARLSREADRPEHGGETRTGA